MINFDRLNLQKLYILINLLENYSIRSTFVSEILNGLIDSSFHMFLVVFDR